MEILLQSHEIENGARYWLQEKFLNITGLVNAKQRNVVNVVIEKVSKTEVKRQEGNTKQAHKYNCRLSILKNFVNKTIEQQNSKNLCPRATYNGRSLIK